ncbi:MAG: hypothetical protein ACJ8G3_22420 [Burkholderiaceae bacterium]
MSTGIATVPPAMPVPGFAAPADTGRNENYKETHPCIWPLKT